MELGLHTLKDFLEVAVWLIGAAALIIGVHTYRTGQKQLSFAVIVSCTERFQKIMPLLKSTDPEKQLEAVSLYLDLCHEELFYFKHGYLPEEIIDEWLDGMIHYLPHFMDSNNVNESDRCLIALAQDGELEGYPRVRKSFTVNRTYDLTKDLDRRLLVESVKRNLKV